MVFDINNLNNITPYSFNESFNSATASQVITERVIESTNDIYIFSILVVLFLFMMVNSMDLRDIKAVDFVSSGILSAGVCLILSGLALLLGFTNSYNVVKFFGTILFMFVASKIISN